jgi:4-amino-4-deoxychorismate lyase
VFIDADRYVGECSNMNVAFVTADGVLKHPKFDHILSGCTSLRLLELAQGLVSRGLINGVEVGNITVTDARRSREMLLLGSSIRVAPVVAWDNQPIGDGKPGPVSKALLELLDRTCESSVTGLSRFQA